MESTGFSLSHWMRSWIMVVSATTFARCSDREQQGVVRGIDDAAQRRSTEPAMKFVDLKSVTVHARCADCAKQ